jgi:hypothetical protein
VNPDASPGAGCGLIGGGAGGGRSSEQTAAVAGRGRSHHVHCISPDGFILVRHTPPSPEASGTRWRSQTRGLIQNGEARTPSAWPACPRLGPGRRHASRLPRACARRPPGRFRRWYRTGTSRRDRGRQRRGAELPAGAVQAVVGLGGTGVGSHGRCPRGPIVPGRLARSISHFAPFWASTPLAASRRRSGAGPLDRSSPAGRSRRPTLLLGNGLRGSLWGFLKGLAAR